MTRFFFLIALWALLGGAPTRAAEPPNDEILTPKVIGELTLDDLFQKLPEHAGSRTGRAIEAEILERFNSSGSDTADLLMSWAAEAINAKNYAQALDILDHVVLLRPNFAEGWNRRATAHYLNDDYGNSLADIRNALALEPRHFGALSGLGLILEDTGHKDKAVEAFRRALELNPQLENVKKSLERLDKAIEGNSI